jgi:hypothetical protein
MKIRNWECLEEETKYEEYYLPGYNTVQFVEIQLTFRKYISLPFSGFKNKPSKKPA